MRTGSCQGRDSIMSCEVVLNTPGLLPEESSIPSESRLGGGTQPTARPLIHSSESLIGFVLSERSTASCSTHAHPLRQEFQPNYTPWVTGIDAMDSHDRMIRSMALYFGMQNAHQQTTAESVIKPSPTSTGFTSEVGLMKINRNDFKL
jgi:hypothetical protein